MEFNSPRFQGDSLLLEILNDPNTGQKKLKKGSPPGPVRKVQQALLDLHWVEDAGLIAEELFVDGDYGNATEGTVRVYKAFYGLTYPPGDPFGIIDGYTGPLTLAVLDRHCTLFDAARAALQLKADELIDEGWALKLSPDYPAPGARPIFGTFGASIRFDVDGVAGEIAYSPANGAFEVHGPIYIEWLRRGFATGPFGFPTSDEYEDDNALRVSDFEGGSIHLNADTGRLSGSLPGSDADRVRRGHPLLAVMATYELGPDTFLIVRPEDLLHLEVVVSAAEGLLTLSFPCQHVMEFPDGERVAKYADETTLVPAPDLLGEGVAHWAMVPSVAADSGWNYLTFRLPPGVADRLTGDVLAQLDGQSSIAGGVEFPAMLVLEPFGEGRWRLGPQPLTGNGWTAVWRAELRGTSGAVPGLHGPLMQVTHTQDKGFEPPSFGVKPFTLFPQFRGAVFRSSQLSLSMLGASGRIQGPHWPPGVVPEPGAGVSYDHKAQFGRDQEWTLVLRGALSSGHPAELTLVTTRVFAQMTYASSGFPSVVPETYARGQTYLGARLYETATLRVLDPLVSFEGVDTPFRWLRLNAEAVSQIDTSTEAVFWVTRGHIDVQFAMVATDWAGHDIPFTTPLMFIPTNADGSSTALRTAFESGDPARRRINLAGAPVTLANHAARGDVTVDAVTMPVHTVALELADCGLGAGSAMVPATVEVAIESVGRLTDNKGLATCRLVHGFDAAGTFLTIAGGMPIGFKPAQAGGLASPNARLGAVNALLGAIPNPTEPAAAVFGDAKLLGVPLAVLLAATQPAPPTLTSERLPDSIVTRYAWTPTLDAALPADVVKLEPGATLELKAELTQPLDPIAGQPRPPTSRVEGTLTKVKLALLDVIEVTFERVHFLDEPNSSPKVSATGCAVRFTGDLAFVSKLADEIGDFGSDSPVAVDADGITAGYVVALPKVPFGVFSLANISLGAQVRIPFDDKPASVRFNFAERHAPFTVAVGLFGGGGFLALTATANVLERIEGSLEFGGNFELDVVVAKGHVFAFGGVSFLRADDDIWIEGYLRCGGHLEILDIIGVTLEFEVALRYVEEGGRARVHGRATVTVGVQVLLFNESVSFTVERSFSASDDRNEALEFQMDDAAWDRFCLAFA